MYGESNDYFRLTVAQKGNICMPAHHGNEGSNTVYLCLCVCVCVCFRKKNKNNEDVGVFRPNRYLLVFFLFFSYCHAHRHLSSVQAMVETMSVCLASGYAIKSKAGPINKHHLDSQAACLHDTLSNLSSCKVREF